MSRRTSPGCLRRWALAVLVAVAVGFGLAPQPAGASHAPPIFCPGVEVMGIDVLNLDCIP